MDLEFPLAYIWKVIERLWQRWTEVSASVLPALSPRSRAGYLTSSSRSAHVGRSDQTWKSHAVTTAKSLYSPSSFRLLSPPLLINTPPFLPLQVPALLLSRIPLEPAGEKIHPVHLVRVCTSRTKTWKSTGGKMGLVHKGVKEVQSQEG